MAKSRKKRWWAGMHEGLAPGEVQKQIGRAPALLFVGPSDRNPVKQLPFQKGYIARQKAQVKIHY